MSSVKSLEHDLIKHNQANFSALVPGWMMNFRRNLPIIEADFATEDHNFTSLPWRPERLNHSWALCSSGPSLDQAIPYLKTFGGRILCGLTNLETLLANDIVPDAAVAVDGNIHLAERVQRLPAALRAEVPLVASATVHPAVLEAFPQRYYLYTFIQGVIETTCPTCSSATTFLQPIERTEYNAFLRLLAPEIRNWVIQGGSVGNTLPMLVGILQLEGRVAAEADLFLLGMDLGYPGGRARCTQYQWADNDKVLALPDPPIKTPGLLCKSFNGVLTDTTCLNYKRSLLTWWHMSWTLGNAITPLRLWDLSEGVLTELPKDPSKPYPTREEVITTFQDYQRRIGFEREHEGGTEAIDLEGPEKDIDFWRNKV